MNNELIKKEKRAIFTIQTFNNWEENRYVGCYSGGKDSDVIYILSKLANINVEWVHNLTTADAPETVNYVREHKDIKILKPEKTMWQLIVDHGTPPTRVMRYCCADLKENQIKGKLKILGVRWAESKNRQENADLVKIIGKPQTTKKLLNKLGAEYSESKKGGIMLSMDNDISKQAVEQCYRTRDTQINPIIDWTDEEVWEFLRFYGCEGNPLYQCGFNRIGCIGCPMAGKHRYVEFARYPKYKENYIRAFDRMIKKNKELNRERKLDFADGEECFRWWLEEDINQIRFEDL